MKSIFHSLVAAAGLLALGAWAQRPSGGSLNRTPFPGYRWSSVYLFDQDQAALTLTDLAVGGPECALAVGALTEGRGRAKPVTLIGRDPFTAWELVPIKPEAGSVFALGATVWATAENGVWQSADCGRNWQNLSREKQLSRVYFLDRERGFGAGYPKKVVRTSDGGRTWEKVNAADEPKSDPERSIYSWIAFANPLRGVIIGWHQPRRPDRLRMPAWMDPEDARRLRQWPSLSLMLETADGGKTWKPASSSLMGRLTRFRYLDRGPALSLIEFDYTFEWPSEVYRITPGDNVSTRTFREADRAITDIALLPTGIAYLAGYEPPGALRQLPVPGKVRIIRSSDLAHWQEMEVDYRASAQRVFLAVGEGLPPLAATDTGMILRLSESR